MQIAGLFYMQWHDSEPQQIPADVSWFRVGQKRRINTNGVEILAEKAYQASQR